MQATNFSAQKLKLLANYVAAWPGKKIGQFGLISIANAAGTKPPLIWVFNAAHEFPALAEALGDDQPLIGLRSLNTVVKVTNLTTWDERVLAEYYAKDLTGFLGQRPCFIGGNCQGAPIAAELARRLILSECDVRGGIFMEWTDLPVLPIRCMFLFGAESKEHNPFLRGLDPWPMWHRLYPEVSCDILPGGHGIYFQPDNIGVLANLIQSALAQSPAPAPIKNPSLAVEGLPKTALAGKKLSAYLSSQAELAAKTEMVMLWDSHFPCLPHRQRASLTLGADQIWRFEYSTPDTPGLWTLQTFQCREGHGPQNWAGDTVRYQQVRVNDGLVVENCADVPQESQSCG